MSTEIYDPNAPEGDAGAHSQYISRRDVKILLAILVVVVLILLPIYSMGVRNSQRSICLTNLGAIAKAIGMYAVEHDDRLPPVYRVGNDGVTPEFDAQGLPWTWASDIYGYKSTRTNFICPAAKKDELVATETPDGGRFLSSYGMYLPYSTFITTEIPDPSRTVILAETSNQGANESFDPLSFRSDGFLIGWNNSNTEPNRATTSVSRLAFRGTAKGLFDKDAAGRHDKGTHAITGSFGLITLKPKDAKVTVSPSTGLPTGIWAVP